MLVIVQNAILVNALIVERVIIFQVVKRNVELAQNGMVLDVPIVIMIFVLIVVKVIMVFGLHNIIKDAYPVLINMVHYVYRARIRVVLNAVLAIVMILRQGNVFHVVVMIIVSHAVHLVVFVVLKDIMFQLECVHHV